VAANLEHLRRQWAHTLTSFFTFCTQISTIPKLSPSHPHVRTRCIPQSAHAPHFPNISSHSSSVFLHPTPPSSCYIPIPSPPPVRSTRTVPFRTTLNIMPHVQGSSYYSELYPYMPLICHQSHRRTPYQSDRQPPYHSDRQLPYQIVGPRPSQIDGPRTSQIDGPRTTHIVHCRTQIVGPPSQSDRRTPYQSDRRSPY
jgi:hypothetical protein